MTYQQTLHWMFERLPMFQRQGASAFKKNLDNIILLCERLGNPQTCYKTIHVGGTNGKGSTSHMLASVLQEQGYKTGLHTSPHLKDFRERIRVNGNLADEMFVIQFIAQHKAFIEQNQLSFFELTVGMAFQYFKEQKVDVAVIEVGLGGRLDSTNIISPILSVITNIGLDHTAILGHTLEAIAAEKAGIIKSNIPVVIGERQAKTTVVFDAKAKTVKTEISYASDFEYPELESELKGSYQFKNKRTVQRVVAVLNRTTELYLSQEALVNGIRNVITNTGLLGRWQIIQESNPKIVCDTGHNKEGLTYVMKQIAQEDFKQLHIVLGVVSDKDLDSVLPLFPKNALYYFGKPDVPRGLDAVELQQKAKQYKLEGKKFEKISAAFEAAKTAANTEDLIFIGGSTFVVAEII